MKCWNCGKKIKDDSIECPFCGEEIGEKSSQNEEENLEKTIAISKVDDDTKRLLDLTLINDIKSEIDRLSKQNEEEEIIPDTVNEDEDDDGYLDLSSNESVKERKRIFFMVGIVAFLLFFIIILLIVFGNRGNTVSEEVNNNNSTNYETELVKSLDEYYEKREIDGVIYIVESVKNDNTKIERVHDITNEKCKEWLKSYKDKLDDNKKEFSESTTYYKNIIEGLNRYAVAKVGSSYIKALSNEDYDKFIKEIDTIYSDGLGFYDALSYYNKKDYNKAYALLGAIEDTNVFYDKAESYRNKIISNVTSLLKKDIVKVSKNIDSLSEDDKLNRYIQIEELILKYDDIYTNLNLKSNKDYNSLLNDYRSKIEDLSN